MHEQIIEPALQIGFADQRLSLADALQEAAEQVAAGHGVDLDAMDDVDACEFGEVTEDVRTFAAAGLLTESRGVVLRFADGAEVQVTIVPSRRPYVG